MNTQYTLAERKTVPELGCSSPAIKLSIVDLPIPLGPTTAEKHLKMNQNKDIVKIFQLKKQTVYH